MSRKTYSISDCPVCKVVHNDEVPVLAEDGCLCCQTDHKPVCGCGEPGYIGPDPFDADVHNDPTPCIICEECADMRAREV